MRYYIYVDGESHCVNAERSLERFFGSDYAQKSIVQFVGPRQHVPMNMRADCRFFWDEYHYRDAFHVISPERQYYFTCFTGTPEGLFDAKVFLKKQNFDPHIIHELKDLSKARDNMLNKDAVLIKAKGVDTELAVRLLEDAYSNLFDACILYTSDADIIPAIEAVRRRGKRVFVVGHSDCLQKNSPLFYIPERFIDIGGSYFKDHFGPKPPGLS